MDQYEFLSIVGKGSFGVVHKVQRKSDNKILACKELNYGIMSEREKQQLVSEVNILRELNHPNIVRYYDRFIDKKQMKIYLFTEYCSNGDLATLLRKCKKDKDYIAEDVIWKLFSQLLQSLDQCHNHGVSKILHRDLKPANIFLDENNNIKLGDFGLSRILHENSLFAKTRVGTPYYMSPEQINEVCYDEKCDIWSCGCLLYELAALKPPFEATNHLSLAMKIKAGKYERIPLKYSEDLFNLINQMLDLDSSKRPIVTDLLNLPLVNLKIKEKKLREKHSWIKQKEEELKLKEEKLRQWEETLIKQEQQMMQKI